MIAPNMGVSRATLCNSTLGRRGWLETATGAQPRVKLNWCNKATPIDDGNERRRKSVKPKSAFGPTQTLRLASAHVR